MLQCLPSLSIIFQLYRGCQVFIFFLVEEIEVPGENHRPATSHWQKNVVSSTSRHEWDCDLTTLVVINTDCSGLWKWRNVIFYEL